jgi:hypothetical protein
MNKNQVKIIILTPKIPWDQKLVVYYLGTLWEEKHLLKKNYFRQINSKLFYKFFGNSK